MASNSEVVFILIVYFVDDAVQSLSVIRSDFVLTVQGIDQCPDPSYADSIAAASARSQLDCARRCSIVHNCIYHSYRKDIRMCRLYKSTPDRLLPTANCKFMAVSTVSR